MKPREQGGVVDERLNVYGVQNLKIAGNYLLSSLQKLDTVTYYFNPSFFRLQYCTRQRRS